MKKFILLLSFIALFSDAFSQIYTQTIRGVIVDKQSQMTLPGATVLLLNSNPPIGSTSDIDGRFRLENVPIGRQGIQISFMGYEPVTISNLIINSAKETILRIELEEQVVTTDEVVITAYGNKSEAINEMATISARSFTVEETEKYAGSRGDVARMAMNYAGVSGANDQRNDIIVRGNSPTGLLWKLEDVDIGNPNHFALTGTTGGAVGMLNNNVLRNSDFFTGAFPAEYGNALSGVFDLKMRSGNNEKMEFLGQVGFNGYELGVEGPFSKKSRSSYLANYRYSTLGLLDKMGVSVGTSGIPYYQDLSYKVNIPTKKGKIAIFGLAGTSNISMLYKNKSEDDVYEFGKTDLYNGSDLAVTGISFTHFLNDKTFIKTILSGTYVNGGTTIDTIDNNGESHEFYKSVNSQHKLALNVILNKKFNSRLSSKTGMTIDRMGYDLNGKIWNSEIDDYESLSNNKRSLSDGVQLYRGYNQWLYKYNKKLSFTPGIHLIYFDYNSKFSIEPRIGMKWKINDKQSFSAGYGKHARLQALPTYFLISELSDGKKVKTNKYMDFTKAHHFVIGYDINISNDMRIKAEAYYQSIYDVPVEQRSSPFSMLNSGAAFGMEIEDSLVNDGVGTNIGIELTLEKFFSKGYYYLATVSLFDSKYTGSDDVERSTAFNGNYVVNALMGKEINLSNKGTLFFDIKGTFAGGNPYIPIDLDASRNTGSSFFATRYDQNRAFSEKHSDYMKIDVKIGFRLDGKKVSQEWMVYVENVTNQKNILSKSYNVDLDKVTTTYQLGIFPMMQYRIYF